MDFDGEGSARTGSALMEREGLSRAPVVGVITELLPSALYRVRLDGGRLVTAHIADRMDRNFVRLLVGDRVSMELSPVDIGRGRIVEKVDV